MTEAYSTFKDIRIFNQKNFLSKQETDESDLNFVEVAHIPVFDEVTSSGTHITVYSDLFCEQSNVATGLTISFSDIALAIPYSTSEYKVFAQLTYSAANATVYAAKTGDTVTNSAGTLKISTTNAAAPTAYWKTEGYISQETYNSLLSGTINV